MPRQMRSSELLARLALLAVLCLAAWLRWQALDVVEFKYDEAHTLGIASRIAAGHALPALSGGASLGLTRGALIPYVQALFLRLIGPRPEAAVWGMGALAVLAVALTFVLGSRLHNRLTGLLAALFMAASPWPALWDRKLWAHILPLLSVALLLLAWEATARRRRYALIWFPALAALQLQAHVLALVQAASWLGGFLLAPRRWLRRPLLLGLLAAGLITLPYAWALMASAPPILNSDLGLWRAQTGGGALSLAERWLQARQFLTGAGLGAVAAIETAWTRAGDALSLPLLALLAAGLARVLLWLRGSRQRPAARLLLAWTAPPILLLVLAPAPVFLHYWSTLLPLPALFLALGLEGCSRVMARLPGGGRLSRLLPAAAALLIAAVWLGSFQSLLAAVATGAGGASFGPPLRAWQAAIAAAEEEATRLGLSEVRVAVRGVDPAQQGDPAVVALLIGNPPWARFVAPAAAGEPALLLKAGQPSLYLWTLPGDEALARRGELVWQGQMATGLPPARLYRLPPVAEIDLDITWLPQPAQFDAGLALIAYAFPPPGALTPRVTLVWQVLTPPEEARQRDLTLFNHIYDQTGARVAQADGFALLSRDWWPGDVVVQPYEIDLPAGEYRWQTGIYSRSDGGRAALLDGGDAFTLPPLLWP